jgi:hypothetical protein
MDHSFDLVRFLSSKSSVTIPIRETKNPRFFNIYIALKLQINNIPKAKVASLKLECGKTLFLHDNLDVITLVTLSFCTYRVYSYGNVNPLTHHGLLFTHPIQT